jgi:hypothetical protein
MHKKTKMMPATVLLFAMSPGAFGQSQSALTSGFDVIESQIQASHLLLAGDASNQLRLSVEAVVAGRSAQSINLGPAGRPLYTVPAQQMSALVSQTEAIRAEVEAGALSKASVHLALFARTLYQAHTSLKPSASAQLANLEQTLSQGSSLQRLLLLPDVAVAAYTAGDYAKAAAYSSELLASANTFSGLDQGEAVFYGNLIAGRLALGSGNPAAAGTYLLSAGQTSGSPRLKSFGPSMSLAAELLAQGQTSVVLQFLQECQIFWKNDRSRLAEWTADIQQGRAPAFPAN